MINVEFPLCSVPRLSLFTILEGLNIQPQLSKTTNSKNGAVFLDDLSILVYFALLI